MRILEILLSIFCVVISLFIVWISGEFIRKSTLYRRYLQYKRTKKLLGDSNKKRLEKKRALLMEKLSNIPVVNLGSENLDEAQKLLNINVIPLEFNHHVIQTELRHSQYIEDRLFTDIVSKAALYQMPIRTVYTTVVSGIDDAQDVENLLKMRYTKGSFFLPDVLLSPTYIDTLLGRNIVLLGICNIGSIYSKRIQVLLLPYEVEIQRKSSSQSYVVSPQGLMKV